MPHRLTPEAVCRRMVAAFRVQKRGPEAGQALTWPALYLPLWSNSAPRSCSGRG